MIKHDTVFTLTRESKPKLSEGNKELVQAEAVYGFLKPYGSIAAWGIVERFLREKGCQIRLPLLPPDSGSHTD
jgi:hypothetical protein